MISNYKYNSKLYFVTTFIVTYALYFAGAWVSEFVGREYNISRYFDIHFNYLCVLEWP